MSLNNKSIGFIGAGNMAGALIRGLIGKGMSGGRIMASDIDQGRLQTLQTECGVEPADNDAIAADADVVVLAVKPQVMATVCRQIAAAIDGRDCVVVSIAAGITIEHLQGWLGKTNAVVRCMPNTPALVGRGATALAASDTTSAPQRALAESILAAVGLVVWLEDEADMDAVTALSGSGPAYFFLFMEAMQTAAVELGLDAETARQLTCQTALGAAELAAASNVDVAELRRQVTSPGGTTEQALNSFESGGLRKLVGDALAAARRRSTELANEFGN